MTPDVQVEFKALILADVASDHLEAQEIQVAKVNIVSRPAELARQDYSREVEHDEVYEFLLPGNLPGSNRLSLNKFLFVIV